MKTKKQAPGQGAALDTKVAGEARVATYTATATAAPLTAADSCLSVGVALDNRYLIGALVSVDLDWEVWQAERGADHDGLLICVRRITAGTDEEADEQRAGFARACQRERAGMLDWAVWTKDDLTDRIVGYLVVFVDGDEEMRSALLDGIATGRSAAQSEKAMSELRRGGLDFITFALAHPRLVILSLVAVCLIYLWNGLLGGAERQAGGWRWVVWGAGLAARIGMSGALFGAVVASWQAAEGAAWRYTAWLAALVGAVGLICGGVVYWLSLEGGASCTLTKETR